MDNQEIFNIVYQGLKSQDFRQSVGTDINRTCLYRGPNNTKCAFGHLIPDDVYDKRLEERSIQSLIDTKQDFKEQLSGFFEWLSQFSEDHLFLLRILQYAHDCYVDPSSMQKRLKEIAERYNLTIPE
jgi:hypothetical protein